MTRALTWGGAVLAGAALVHVAAITMLPHAIMSRVLAGLAARGGENAFVHPELATAASRTIVRPSPDLAYSSAVFDVSERPLRVIVPLTAPYTSLSGFAANSDNFFAVNDRSVDGGEIDVLLVGPSTPRAGLGGGPLIESPSDRGVLLVRRVVPSADAFAAIDAVRQRARVEAVAPGG